MSIRSLEQRDLTGQSWSQAVSVSVQLLIDVNSPEEQSDVEAVWVWL